MIAYAERHRMDYLGNALPSSLPLERLPFWRSTDNVENLMLGELGGSETAIFDLHANRGKQSSIQTAIALKVKGGVEVPPRTDISKDSPFVESTGEWLVYFVYKRVVGPADLHSLIADAKLYVGTRTSPRP
jgi:hypothetical protein